MPDKIAVLGAGAWGIALADLLTRGGQFVELWARTADVADMINSIHRTPRLHDIPLHPDVRCYTDAGRVLKDSVAVVSVIVSHKLRAFLRDTAPLWPRHVRVVSATKGLESDTYKRMTQVLSDEVPALSPDRLAVLSGPNLAGEVAQGKPASSVIAAYHQETARFFQQLLHSDAFRVYTVRDIVGVELCGAIKNVIAIAAGMCSGLQLGDNAVAAVAARGLAEIKRLGEAVGAYPETFSGLAGFGDIIVTCCGRGSRNRGLGEEIGRGKPPAQAIGERKSVAEGVKTVEALYQLSRKLGVSLPISEIVYAVLFQGFPVDKAADALMRRDARAENE
ncbi:MAG: NAD(P)-dependent glycerol-3-phosphate dehydrogenase [Oscillospiraceae bacterium]|nr:NAD(P)-dependent glycerol-3-phosphate dehydrogenase [Oscillospiraceae bacterium]